MTVNKQIETAVYRESVSNCLFQSVPSQILYEIPSSQIVNDPYDDYKIVDEYQINAANIGSLDIKISVTNTREIGININKLGAIGKGNKCLMGNEPMPFEIDVLAELIAIFKYGNVVVRQNKITKEYKALIIGSLKSDISGLKWLKTFSRHCHILYEYIPMKAWPTTGRAV